MKNAHPAVFNEIHPRGKRVKRFFGPVQGRGSFDSAQDREPVERHAEREPKRFRQSLWKLRIGGRFQDDHRDAIAAFIREAEMEALDLLFAAKVR